MKKVRKEGGEVNIEWLRYMIKRYEKKDVKKEKMVGLMKRMIE